jgi:hypothetical protein
VLKLLKHCRSHLCTNNRCILWLLLLLLLLLA